MKNFTKETFWENFWREIKVPVKVDMDFKNDFIIAQSILKYFPKACNKNKKSLEIGCAPGKWMIFIHDELGYIVDGCEYVQAAAEKTQENLIFCGIKQSDFNLIVDDFFKIETNNRYDVVYSLGFVEHFSDFNSIMNKHLSLVNEEGILFISYPSFRGLNYFIQKQIDPYLEDPLLPAHNLDVMNLNIHKKYAKLNNLQLLSCSFVGGFEPALFDSNKITNIFRRISIKVLVKMAAFIFKKSSSKLFSSYIIVVYKRS